MGFEPSHLKSRLSSSFLSQIQVKYGPLVWTMEASCGITTAIGYGVESSYASGNATNHFG
jgi:hypothetical protein